MIEPKNPNQSEAASQEKTNAPSAPKRFGVKGNLVNPYNQPGILKRIRKYDGRPIFKQ